MHAGNFNPDYAKQVSLDEWVETHKHLGKKKDLEPIYKELVKDKEPEKPKEEK